MWILSVLCLFAFFIPSSSAGKEDDRVYPLPSYQGPATQFRQYAGFLDLSSGNQLYYWLTQSSSPTNTTDPVMLWLNGGPGCSSITGLMTEMGPFRVIKDGKALTNNPYAWNQFAHIIFLDAPAGVGFSRNNQQNFTFTDSQVAADNLEALNQFFLRFPELKANDLYVGGESYGGTYVPMVADLIVKQAATFPTFKGILVGNGCLKEDLRYNSQIMFNYNHDFISEQDYNDAVQKCCNGQPGETCDWYSLSNKSDRECADIADQLEEANFYSGLDPYFEFYVCYFNTSAGAKSEVVGVKSTSFLFRRQKGRANGRLVTEKSCHIENQHIGYLNRADVQRTIHVQPTVKYESCNQQVAMQYVVEFDDMTPFVKRIVAAGKKVLFFNGNADTVCSFVHNQKFVAQLGYPLVHPREAWTFATKVPDVAGFYTGYQGVDYLTISGAGHFASSTLEKPRESLQMFANFLAGRNYSTPFDS